MNAAPIPAAPAPSGGSPLLASLDKVDRVVGAICRLVVGVTGAALLASITIGVVARYVITVGGVDWAEELPKQLFAWFIMAGVVLAVQGILMYAVMAVIERRMTRWAHRSGFATG